ncbi:MAG: hypothetical protein WBZ31_01975 [Thiobacillus sp.]
MPIPSPCHGWLKPWPGSIVSCGHKKTGPKAGFFVPWPGITWREQEQQRQRPGQQEQQRQRPEQQEQQRQRPEQQALQQQEPEQQQALQRAQQLLLFCRKRSWKQPTEQPGGWNISFDFPFRTYKHKNPHQRSVRDLRSSRRADFNKSAKENHNLLNFFYCSHIALLNYNKTGHIGLR